MPQVAEVAWQVAGDIGGLGVSRFRFIRQNAGSIMGADVTAAVTAQNAFFGSMTQDIPVKVSWTVESQVDIYDSESGIVQGPLVVTSPPTARIGTGAGNYPAGVGARVNWKTSTLVGRRLLKGALYLVPLYQGVYTSSGAIDPAIAASLQAAANTYINAMTTALLYPVVWHRPAKGTGAGGMTGIITAGVVSQVPASLRSRRT